MTPDEIKNIRLQAKLTQVQAADLIGVSRTTWLRLESGQCKISKTQEKLVRILLLGDLSLVSSAENKRKIKLRK
jgi:DNA-binding XRE family transcriptional regulator